MTATSRGAQRARPMATDLDRSGLSQPFPLRIAEPGTCVLHLMQDTGRRSPPETTDDVVEAIGRARRADAVPPKKRSAWIDPARVSAVPVRGVAWTSFPVVGEPRYTLSGLASVVAFERAGREASSVGIRETLARSDSVIVHLPKGWDGGPDIRTETVSEWIYKANVVAGAVGDDVRVLLVTPDGMPAGGIGELRALAAGIAPWMRFRYAYAVNFGAMAYRLLDKALAAPDPEAFAVYQRNATRTTHSAGSIHHLLKRTLPERGGWPPDGTGITSPVALQVLYALRRSGGAAPYWNVGNSTGRPWQYDLVDPDTSTLEWRGSGRHAPKTLDPLQVVRAVNALVEFQLLRFGEDGRTVTPSRAGLAFLGLLHPACEDVDLLCRWGHPPYGEDARQAMDAWIGRTFRKLKTKVNATAHAWDVPPGETS